MDFKKPGSSVDQKGVSMIVYGDPGVGKTSLIKTLLGWEYGKGFIHEPYAKPEEIFVIDVEAGDLVLADGGKRLVTTYQVRENLENFRKMVQYLVEEKHAFKYVFIDNMSELEKYFLVTLTESKTLQTPRQKEWGDTSYYMRKNIRDLRNLVWKGVNVIFNFWAMMLPVEDREGKITSYEAPMVMRSTTMEYVGLVDHTAYMGIDKEGKRFLQFDSNQRIKCKSRSDNLDQFERANLAEIFRKIKGGK